MKAAREATGTSSSVATSPATRPTPTTLIGPSASRSPGPNAASATSTMRCGRFTMMVATPAMFSPTIGSTAVAGWRTVSDAGPMPMKPASTVTGSPASSSTTWPFSSVTYRSLRSGVTSTATRSPSRTTTISMGWSGCSRMIAVDSFHEAMATPSTDTISSPGCRPASAPGAAGSPGSHAWRSLVAGRAHSETDPMVVDGCTTPKPMSRIANSTIASSRFMNGPPNMMTTRFHTGSR
jgi:hypothetical protein